MNSIFTRNDGLFRGLHFGIPMDSISIFEGKKPTFKDRCGQVYESRPDSGMNLRLEYFNHCPPAEGDTILKGILVTLELNEETDAVELLGEMERKIRQSEGIPEGAFGNWEWMQRGTPTGIQLKLSPDRKQISLNYFEGS